jgi:hypothetical protein
MRAIGAFTTGIFILHDPFFAADSSCRPLKLPLKRLAPQALLHNPMQAPDQPGHCRPERPGDHPFLHWRTKISR